MEEHHVTVTGGPVAARMLVSQLENAGLRVDWNPPAERRDMASAVEAVAVGLLVYGTPRAVKAVIAKFRERRPNVEIDWREEDGYR